ncbi:hypothetical protein VT84_03360 [Gemmata sp. SH-PL17]|nr:hypothetical protein [Gemmata sp. SH-PL17]AMV23421.1 hypothetical protein VT84_03360 [Gemmata sp. SH-PL17]
MNQIEQVQDRAAVTGLSFAVWVVAPAAVALLAFVQWFDRSGFWYFR